VNGIFSEVAADLVFPTGQGEFTVSPESGVTARFFRVRTP